jgi:hypothetical protein
MLFIPESPDDFRGYAKGEPPRDRQLNGGNREGLA